MEHRELNTHIRRLITIEETESPFVSCYVNLEHGKNGYRSALRRRERILRKTLGGNDRRAFECAFGAIQEFLSSGVKDTTRSVAIFSREGASPYFLALQFRAPLPTELSLEFTPNIYRLVELKDTYHRYILVIAFEQWARILEVSLGAVTRQLWTERPELRKRVGREWTKLHYQSHRRDRVRKFIKETIAVVERAVSSGGHTHLMLAGNPQITAQVRNSLPAHLAATLVDVISASSKDRTTDVVEATLSSFIDQEELESVAAVQRLERDLRRGDLAMVGVDQCLRALRQGQVDVLIIASSYELPRGWSCAGCGAAGQKIKRPASCKECGASVIHDVDVKETMIRLAEQAGSQIETVRDSALLMRLGGVGCLLRYDKGPRVTEVPHESACSTH